VDFLPGAKWAMTRCAILGPKSPSPARRADGALDLWGGTSTDRTSVVAPRG